MIQKISLAAITSALALCLAWQPAQAIDVNKLLYEPAGRCLVGAGRIFTSLEKRLSDAADNDQNIGHAPTNFAGPLANLSVAINNNVWFISGTFRANGCGIISGATVTCYLVDSCAQAIGPLTNNVCSPGGWWGDLEDLYWLSCHVTMKSANVDVFSKADHARHCAALSPYLLGEQVWFDIVDANGAQECNVFDSP